MSLREETALPRFPLEAQQLISDVENKSVLGASRHVRMIVEACGILAEKSPASTGRELVDQLNRALQYFSQTRGQETAAISNAFAWVSKGLRDLEDTPVEEIKHFFVSRCNQFIAQSRQAVEKIARYGANLLCDCQSILAYDYSSSACAILNQIAREGKSIKIIVPESRTVNGGGGRPIVEEVVEYGHTAHFIPDAAIGYFARQADAVLVGIETIFSDGSFTNTLGTLTVVTLAWLRGVPVYAASELLKVDIHSIAGLNRAIESHELAALYEYPESFAKPDSVSVLSPMVEWIPASYLNAYITDLGILAPQVVWTQARDVFYPERGPIDL